MDIIETNFVKPTPKPELGGELGLYAEEVAISLGVPASRVRQKLKARDLISDLEENNMTALTIVRANEVNGLEYNEFVLDARAAKFLVATWANKIGRAYLSFLLTLEEHHESLEQAAASDPLIATMLANAKIRQEQIGQAKALKEIEIKVEALPEALEKKTLKTVEEKFDEVLEKNSDLPDECIRIDEIGPKYFKGTPRNKWKTYLEAKNHPKKSFLYRGEGGAVPSSAFIEEGLNQAALEFYREREFLRETPKLRFYNHPLVGTMQERKE